MSSVYFGGSRHPHHINPAQIAQVVGAVIAQGSRVHVGCQFGADQAVIKYASIWQARTIFTPLYIWAVAPLSNLPAHIQQAAQVGAVVTPSAGGTSAPMPARYLLRSIAAFQGCDLAVFFSPGSGSLAVAREFAKTRKQIFSFSEQPPAPIAGSNGIWCQSFFVGFQCWQWGYYQQNTQPTLF